MVLIRTFVTTPIYSKWLKMHDIFVAITGSMVTMAEAFVFATATKGWHLYYGAAIATIGSIEGTPLTAQLSKMVETTEFGKVFTLVGTAQSIAMTVTNSGFQAIYAATVSVNPGAMYFVAGGVQAVTLVRRQQLKVTNHFLKIQVLGNPLVLLLVCFKLGEKEWGYRYPTRI